jgi:hypothetical protein
VRVSAQFDLPASPEHVYAALTDAAILQRCIPGCESLTPTGEAQFDARVKVGIAALKAVYTGRAELRDRQPPHAFTLAVDGKSAAGFVRVSAAIRLAPADAATRLECDADAQVGGPMAAVGSRLIEAVARQQMGEFFRRLEQELRSA